MKGAIFTGKECKKGELQLKSKQPVHSLENGEGILVDIYWFWSSVNQAITGNQSLGSEVHTCMRFSISNPPVPF